MRYYWYISADPCRQQGERVREEIPSSDETDMRVRTRGRDRPPWTNLVSGPAAPARGPAPGDHEDSSILRHPIPQGWMTLQEYETCGHLAVPSSSSNSHLSSSESLPETLHVPFVFGIFLLASFWTTSNSLLSLKTKVSVVSTVAYLLEHLVTCLENIATSDAPFPQWTTAEWMLSPYLSCSVLHPPRNDV